MRAVTH